MNRRVSMYGTGFLISAARRLFANKDAMMACVSGPFGTHYTVEEGGPHFTTEGLQARSLVILLHLAAIRARMMGLDKHAFIKACNAALVIFDGEFRQ